MRTAVIICGGRNYPPFRPAYEIAYLDFLRQRLGIWKVYEGGAPGADQYGGRWAWDHDMPPHEIHADWHTYGRRAGPFRNERMLQLLLKEKDGHAVIAFPGGSGTAHMLRIAKEAKVALYEYSDEVLLSLRRSYAPES